MTFPPLVEPASELSDAERRRYSRHLLIPNVSDIGQRRLKNARVLCIGAGGLGSAVLPYLAAAGVGTIGIVEFDVVDESNLQRQVIHGTSDLGTSKAQSAKASIKELNPLVNVILHEERLGNDNAIALFEQYDLVIDGTDNFATRYLVNDAAVLTNTPYVWGSILRFDGQASVFWAAHGPCYRCLHPNPPAPGTVPSCSEAGVLGVLCSSIGSIQVTEAIKVITGIGEPLVGKVVAFDALAMRYDEFAVRKDPNCAACGEHPTITELQDYDAFCGLPSMRDTISVSELNAMLEQRARGERSFQLIDVREPHEYEFVHIEGSELIPMGEFVDGSARDKLNGEQIVLLCKVGGRSGAVLAALQRAGYNDAIHVGGGILEWVRLIEPDKPSY